MHRRELAQLSNGLKLDVVPVLIFTGLILLTSRGAPWLSSR